MWYSGRVQRRFHYARSDRDHTLLEGFHAWKHAVRFGAGIKWAVTDDAAALTSLAHQLAPDLTEHVGSVEEVPADGFRSLTPTPPDSHVIALAERRAHSWDTLSAREGRAVVLDHPRSPHNVGAVIRVAAACGIAGVVVLGEVDPWHPSVVRGAAGLQFAVPVLQLDTLPATDRPLIALHEVGTPLPEATIPENALLIFGNERRGISNELRSRAAQTISIPMQEGVSSLNLATSVAVVVYS
ncbi:rRNA methyltransferase [Patescibacteria group bacterium]|jgi:TrmH family RNA methyltransferase|nr:rRNA methyltransferase [Patescibacteria group bacterium]